MSIQVDEIQKELTTSQAERTKLEVSIKQNIKERDTLYEKCQAYLKEKESGIADLSVSNKSLTEARDIIHDLEQQIHRYAGTENTRAWSQVVRDDVVLVKGEDNILSNFAYCPIIAFGLEFCSVEHGYQFKKANDNNLFEEADIIKAQPTAKLAKAKADELIPYDLAKTWEDQSVPVMKYLLNKKKEASENFVTALENTRKKKIVHNVYSPKWGTGKDGKGQNMFGHLLMELRDHINQSQVSQAPPNVASVMPTTSLRVESATVSTSHSQAYRVKSTTQQPQLQHQAKSKPELLLVGNSHLRGIHTHKFSQDFNTKTELAATINDAHQVVHNLKSPPQAMVFQLITNDVKSLNTQDTVKEYSKLVEDTQAKFPNTKIHISLAPNKPSTSKISTRITAVNATLTDMYQDSSVTCIKNSHINSFTKDDIHLTKYGTSALVRSIKTAVYHSLGLTMSTRYQSIQASHNRFRSRTYPTYIRQR